MGDIRMTVLQIVNEVQRKLGLSPTQTLSANTQSKIMVDYLNDVVNDLSDFGNWIETIATARVTAVSGQRNYSINTSANIKNIGDIYFSQRSGALLHIDTGEMRLLTRSTVQGMPTQFTIFKTDSNGNPEIMVRPTPGATQDGGVFSILYFTRPPTYTTSDSSTVVPFPSRVVVLGLLAKMCLDDSGGAPEPQYQEYQNQYLVARKEALNRFKADTGWSVRFRPGYGGRKRR